MPEGSSRGRAARAGLHGSGVDAWTERDEGGRVRGGERASDENEEVATKTDFCKLVSSVLNRINFAVCGIHTYIRKRYKPVTENDRAPHNERTGQQ